jgi:hypothetical protein
MDYEFSINQGYLEKTKRALIWHTHGAFLVSLIAVLVVPASVSANMSTTPWIHEIIQNGQEVEITFSVFEDSSEERVLEHWNPNVDSDGIPFPDLSNAYTLERFGEDDNDWGVIFEDRIFSAQDADLVTDYTCQFNEIAPDIDCGPKNDGCIDCDDDDIAECRGFCAVAYRYTVVDSCPPPGNKYYRVNTPEAEIHMGEIMNDSFDRLGLAAASVSQSNASCIEEESSNCSVASAGSHSARCLFLILLMLL